MSKGGRNRKLMVRIVAILAAAVLIVGVLFGGYSMLDRAKGETYYIDMNEIDDAPVVSDD